MAGFSGCDIKTSKGKSAPWGMGWYSDCIRCKQRNKECNTVNMEEDKKQNTVAGKLDWHYG